MSQSRQWQAAGIDVKSSAADSHCWQRAFEGGVSLTTLLPESTLTVVSQNESSVGSGEAEDEVCDGEHPGTGRVCVLGAHAGCHQSDDGIHWLDD